ncbi:adenylate/guanylate cyclase domain-containing pr otein [Desulfonema ishimotonii]|uniref:diguanylate cyclase n=1 Tax=Desulfonema ishimotonii TaxID=45657 RepID=A0A401FVP3_9BACT|nr:diguanylate cyclase [Desulfonema ishimotonii]GBC61030.1 adenylate/guanylate cyclase domain-containing pr otein [Desulfonema ishimotonii]
MKENDHIFSKERRILEDAESVLKQEKTDIEGLLEAYMALLKGYKKLLRQTRTLTRVSDNQQRKLNRILDRLGRYVSYQLVKKITHESKEEIEVRARRKKLTVFFSDLKDFSYTSSHMEGEELSEFLNSYLEAMTRIVIKWGGTLDKYMGDAIMVFFGDPDFTSDKDHALRCVRMAIEMREKMKGMREKWYNMGYQEPLHCRIGIASGYCTVGNFGSSERMDYTIIGAPVNLAARLESAADVDEIFISHETWGYVRDQVRCDPPASLRLKGFHHPILAHKVLSARGEEDDNIFCINDEVRDMCVQIDFSNASRSELIAAIRMQEQSRYSATHDPLTGLLNREAILGRLKTEVSRAEREMRSLSMALLDLDHFQEINDRFGRAFGDAVLCEAVRRIRACLRNYDIVGRCGGDEMLLIVPGADSDAARKLFCRISQCVSDREMTFGKISERITASMGCATFEGKMSPEMLVSAAREALCRAKSAGAGGVAY